MYVCVYARSRERKREEERLMSRVDKEVEAPFFVDLFARIEAECADGAPEGRKDRYSALG